MFQQDDGASPGLWLAIYDLRQKTVTQRVHVNSQLASPGYLASGVRQSVIFAPNQNYLIVQDLRAVTVFDSKTLQSKYSVTSQQDAFPEPIRTKTDQNGSRLVITYGAGNTFAHDFQVNVLDLASGRQLANWRSPSIIQSISPEGGLAVRSDSTHHNAGGVQNLQIVNTLTGIEIKTIPVDYAFRRRDSEVGSVVARFLDANRLIICSDNMVDRTGHHSGESLEIISASDGTVLRRISPKYFGPTGELEVSPDGKYFAVVSAYADPKIMRADGPLPNPYKPEVVIADKDHDNPFAVIPNLEGNGLSTNELLPSLSSGASVLAVAHEGTIEVFRRTT